jgi:hypothetical protein
MPVNWNNLGLVPGRQGRNGEALDASPRRLMPSAPRARQHRVASSAPAS